MIKKKSVKKTAKKKVVAAKTKPVAQQVSKSNSQESLDEWDHQLLRQVEKKVEKKIVYDTIKALPYFDKKYNPKSLGALTAAKAKQYLGWQEDSDSLGHSNTGFHFKDRNGIRIRCSNNLQNRKFSSGIAHDYMLELLRGKWELNGESCVIDETGMVQDCQHRFIGLVWAVQEWTKRPDKWPEWNTEPVMNTIVMTGISSDDKVINTLNTGRKRSLGDVFYRSEYFRDVGQLKRQRMAKVAESAIKFIWYRTVQASLSQAPRMPHSEAIQLVESHPRILEAVRYIVDRNGNNNLIQGYLPLGQATACFYLMGTSNTDRSEYEPVRTEEAMDFDTWRNAKDFLKLVLIKSKHVEPLLEALLGIPDDVSGGYVRDLRFGVLAKSWDLYLKKKKLTEENVSLKHGKDEYGHPTLLESPLFGGLDLGGDKELASPSDEEEDK